MDWDELKQRVLFLRGVYQRLGFTLPQGQGLALALQEAEAIADGVVSPLPATDANAAASAHAAHVVWTLADNVRRCIDAGLDIQTHLRNIGTGSTAFGARDLDNRAIYYKDFEYELFIIAMLLERGVTIQMPPAANDPLCEFEAEGLPVQLKHPSSQARPARRLHEFNQRLVDADRIGIFVIGIEDMFELADGGQFDEQAGYDAWLAAKRAEMEHHGLPILQSFRRYPRIAGVVQTATFVRYIGGDSQLTRSANSCVFDGGDRAAQPWFAPAMRVLEVFNPDPVKASEV